MEQVAERIDDISNSTERLCLSHKQGDIVYFSYFKVRWSTAWIITWDGVKQSERDSSWIESLYFGFTILMLVINKLSSLLDSTVLL
jgi:hypothetical protein